MARFSYRSTRSAGNLGLSGTASSPLTEDQLRREVPSIFAAAKHEDRSARYAYVPTSEILEGLRNEFGFQPVFACEAATRVIGKRGFTKHMIRLRQENAPKVAGSTAEIILINSHDGSSGYVFRAGAFSFVCANGLICGDTFEALSLHHKGDAARVAMEHAARVSGYFPFVYQNIEAMKDVTMSRDEQVLFACEALRLKFNPTNEVNPDTGNMILPPVTPFQVLNAYRTEERPAANGARDLYTTFNVVQEHLVRGGDHYTTRNEDTGQRRRVTTRRLTSVDGNVSLNAKLWDAASNMAKLYGVEVTAPERTVALAA